jgi:hypothetical protein
MRNRFARNRFFKRVCGRCSVAVASAGAGAMAMLAALVMPVPAAAQGSFENQFRRFFGPVPDERPVDYSRAPAAKKSEVEASTKILVLGDSLADWLAYGLEDSLSETPEIGIIRKNRTFSGLIRYGSSARPDLDWPQAAREAITAEHPQAIVVLLGLQDRQAIREQAQQAKSAKRQSGQAGSAKREEDDPEQMPDIVAPEPQRGGARDVHDYRSERWEQLYNEKIDAMIAAVKTANVPVLWVGMPAIRGARSTSDAQYLNELFRAAADRAGIIFVDVWDGFVDEEGRFATRGPDVEGQIRALRTPDGVHFTRYGARKLAHFVERDLRRVLTAPMPVALTAPADAAQQKPQPSGPFSRPLAGPVLFLASPPHEEVLLGAGTPPKADLQTERVLVKGEAPVVAAGRADDFSWPRAAPNAVVSEKLPPSTAPIYASKPLAKPKAVASSSEHRTLAQQDQMQRPQAAPPPFWRRQPGPPIRSLSDFFGLFSR